MRLLIAIAAIALAACTTTGAQPADTNTVADGASVELAPGESATLADDSRLDFFKWA